MGSRRKQKTEKSMIQNLYWKQVFRSPKTKIGLMVVIIFALAAILHLYWRRMIHCLWMFR